MCDVVSPYISSSFIWTAGSALQGGPFTQGPSLLRSAAGLRECAAAMGVFFSPTVQRFWFQWTQSASHCIRPLSVMMVAPSNEANIDPEVLPWAGLESGAVHQSTVHTLLLSISFRRQRSTSSNTIDFSSEGYRSSQVSSSTSHFHNRPSR